MPYEIDPDNRKCIRKADSKKRVGCTKGSVKKYLAALHANVNESEDFGWAHDMVDSLPTTVFAKTIRVGDEVLFQHMNYDSELHNSLNKKIRDEKWWEGVVISKTPYKLNDQDEYGIRIKITDPTWKPGTHDTSYPGGKDGILKFSTASEYGERLIFKPLTKSGVNESEDFNSDSFEWVGDIINNRYLGFDDLKVGDIVRLKDYDGNRWTVIEIYFFPKQRDGWSEKRIKFKRTKGNSYGNSYLELWKSPLNSKDYFEWIGNNLNEENDFGWAEEIINDKINSINTMSLFLSIQDALKGSDFKIVKDGNLYDIEDKRGDIFMYISEKDFNMPFIYHDMKDSIQFLKDDGDNEMLPYYKKLDKLLTPLYKKNLDKFFKPINESEDDFDWVDFESGIKLGDLWRNDLLNVGDVITISGDVYNTEKRLLAKFDNELFKVFRITREKDRGVTILSGIKFEWIDKTKEKPKDWEEILDYNNMVSVDGMIDSDFNWRIKPVKKSEKINEEFDVEDFGWAEDIIDTTTLSYRGNEIFIDVADFTEEEREKLFEILKPYINFDYGSQHNGDWNPKCIKDKIDLKSVCLHCGTEDFDYIPQIGHVCCLSIRYEDDKFLNPDTTIKIDGRSLLQSRIIETEEFNPDNFEWTDDILFGDIDITNNINMIENLEPGSMLKITGDQDFLVFEGETVEIIKNYPGSKGSLKLVKFNQIMEIGDIDSDIETTHCGGVDSPHRDEKVISKCECYDSDEGVNNSMGIGKCWWVNLLHSCSEVLLLNPKSNIQENKIKKPLLKEGRYDKITGDVVRDIIELVKTEKDGYFQLPDYYEQEGLSFSVEVSIEKSNNPITFEVDAFTLKNFDDDLNDIEEDENIMYLSILLGSKFSQQNFQKLYYKLQEDVRHEIEHFTQEGPYRIEDRPKYDENTSELPPLEHHLNISEIPALVHGFYRRAKLEKKPLDEIMIEDLDSDIAKGNLNKEEAQEILQSWIGYARKNLPHAQYSGEY